MRLSFLLASIRAKHASAGRSPRAARWVGAAADQGAYG